MMNKYLIFLTKLNMCRWIKKKDVFKLKYQTTEYNVNITYNSLLIMRLDWIYFRFSNKK